VSEQNTPLGRQAQVATNLKAIGALLFGLIVGIFGAGVYWSKLQDKIDAAYDFAVKHKDLKSGDEATLKGSLKHWGSLGANPKPPTRSGPGGGKDNPNSFCDDGFYAVGIKTTSNDTNYCNGCLTSVTIECRPLNTE
jgi:hypothetical protein